MSLSSLTDTLFHLGSVQVKDADKLMSIAALFDTTPSRLKKLNKLSMDFIYPGQVGLSVPSVFYSRQ